MLFIGSVSTSSAKFSEFDAGSVILFQNKVLVRNIKETTLARYFIKVTARPSTPLHRRQNVLTNFYIIAFPFIVYLIKNHEPE